MANIRELYTKATEATELDQIADFCRAVDTLYREIDNFCMDLFLDKSTANAIKDKVGTNIMKAVADHA